MWYFLWRMHVCFVNKNLVTNSSWFWMENLKYWKGYCVCGSITPISNWSVWICDVVTQGGEKRHRCQFSWYCDGEIDIPTEGDAWDDSVYLSLLVYGGSLRFDVTEGAMWYHATYADPDWASRLEKTVRINDHIFYK